MQFFGANILCSKISREWFQKEKKKKKEKERKERKKEKKGKERKKRKEKKKKEKKKKRKKKEKMETKAGMKNCTYVCFSMFCFGSAEDKKGMEDEIVKETL